MGLTLSLFTAGENRRVNTVERQSIIRRNMETESELDERVLFYGMTSTGEIVPISVDSNGQIGGI
jgi:hypothetical protein